MAPFICIVKDNDEYGIMLQRLHPVTVIQAWHNRAEAQEDLGFNGSLGSVFFQTLEPRIIDLPEFPDQEAEVTEQIKPYLENPLRVMESRRFWGRFSIIKVNDAGKALYDKGDPVV